MPPRIPLAQCLRAQNASHPPTPSRAFSSTPSSRASTVTQRRKHRDPYAIAQAKARKAANISRQEVLKKERASVLGDPVRGVATPFVRSFDTALPPEPSPSSASTHVRVDRSPAEDAPGPQADADNKLNFFLTKDELATGVKRSQWLTTPSHLAPESDTNSKNAVEKTASSGQTGASTSDGGTMDEIESLLKGSIFGRPDYAGAQSMMDDYTRDETPEERKDRLQQEHDTAQEAIRRISSLSLGSSKDRLRVNVQRCIDMFGRHNTDLTVEPKPASAQTPDNAQQKFPRVGPDTGSSEVQVAILTAKIRTLADSLELRGHPDKMNKRNLRLLVHRRAKLLNYLRRKERGGPRWQNLIETLGLTDGTWKGEISL